MNGSLLLDTNAVIALLSANATLASTLAGTDLFVPIIVIGELYYGAYKSTRVSENLTRVKEFAKANALLGCDEATADYYGQVQNTLRAKGRPIPQNDVWIAAIALQHGLALVTRDAHFGAVDGLALQTWYLPSAGPDHQPAKARRCKVLTF